MSDIDKLELQFTGEELKKVTGVLEINGIMAIPLKGGYLAENVYWDIACRPVSDPDILVKDCGQGASFQAAVHGMLSPG